MNLSTIINNVAIGLPQGTCSAAPYYTADLSTCSNLTSGLPGSCDTLKATVDAANNLPCTPGVTNVTSPTCTCGTGLSPCATVPVVGQAPGRGPSCGLIAGPTITIPPPIVPTPVSLPLPLASCNPNLPSPLGGRSIACLSLVTDVAPQVCLQTEVAPYCTITTPGYTESPINVSTPATMPFIPALAPGCLGNTLSSLLKCAPLPPPSPPSPPPSPPSPPHPPPSPPCPHNLKHAGESCLINQVCCSQICVKTPGHPLLPGKCA